MNEAALRQLVELVARDEGLSLARAAKRLQISQSQLTRMLTVLGASAVLGGADLIEIRGDEPPRLFLRPNALVLLQKPS